MKVVDFHVHPPFNAEERGVDPQVLTERILAWMDGEGIDVAVISPVAPYISNDYIAKMIDYEPKRLIGFASVVPNPADRAVRELKRVIEDLGLRGLKLHPGMQGFCLKNIHLWRVLQFAGELGIPVLIHTMMGDLSTLYFKSPLALGTNDLEGYQLLPFIAPKTIIVLAHMGGSFHFEDFLQIATSDNVYVDTSYSIITITEKVGIRVFASYVKALGAEKFIFGSDYVVGLTPQEYGAKRQIKIVNSLLISNSEKELILYKNACRILKLPY